MNANLEKTGRFRVVIKSRKLNAHETETISSWGREVNAFFAAAVELGVTSGHVEKLREIIKLARAAQQDSPLTVEEVPFTESL